MEEAYEFEFILICKHKAAETHAIKTYTDILMLPSKNTLSVKLIFNYLSSAHSRRCL